MSWVLGYVSGLDMASSSRSGKSSRFKTVDREALELWVTNYCTSNPLNSIYDASLALYLAVTE
ncbi:hypothetical protein [Mesorhizobium sp. M0159]|uniref:hypothetical protein n=1 Tax=Mesorhizobium sp. M0159 TaxID=2956900 RepID=UPI003337860D